MPTEAEKYITDSELLENFKRFNPQGGKAPGGTGIMTGIADKVTDFLGGLQMNQNVPNQSFTRPQFAGQLYDAVKGGFSNLGDFLFGDEDFNYMERSKDERDDATRRFIEKQLEDARMRSEFGPESPELFQERLEAAKMMADREDMRPLPRQGQGLKSRSIAEQMLEAQKFIDPYRVPFGREPFRGIGGMRFKP